MVFGVSEASAAIGEDGTYDVAHAGWVGIHTYRDAEDKVFQIILMISLLS